MLTGNEQFDRWLLTETLDADSLVTMMLTGVAEEAAALIVTMLEMAFDAGRVAGQEDMCETDPSFAVFRAPTAH